MKVYFAFYMEMDEACEGWDLKPIGVYDSREKAESAWREHDKASWLEFQNSEIGRSLRRATGSLTSIPLEEYSDNGKAPQVWEFEVQ